MNQLTPSLTVLKSINGAGLPFYKVGTLKGFQLEGNFGNYAIDLIQSDDKQITPFFTEFVPYISGSYITSFKLYELDENKLGIAYDYNGLKDARGNYYNIPFISIIKEVKGTIYQRYYCNGIDLATKLNAGVYELVLTDNYGRVFESEIFGNCLFKNTNFANIVCSNASCPNRQVGENAVFTITITETNGFNVSNLNLTVNWNINNPMKFDDYTFPYYFESLTANFEDTQTFDLLANETKILTFTYPNQLTTGTYSIDYKLSRGDCSGNIPFTVGNACVSFVSGNWS
jgi:hypothetical protein